MVYLTKKKAKYLVITHHGLTPFGSKKGAMNFYMELKDQKIRGLKFKKIY